MLSGFQSGTTMWFLSFNLDIPILLRMLNRSYLPRDSNMVEPNWRKVSWGHTGYTCVESKPAVLNGARLPVVLLKFGATLAARAGKTDMAENDGAVALTTNVPVIESFVEVAKSGSDVFDKLLTP